MSELKEFIELSKEDLNKMIESQRPIGRFKSVCNYEIAYVFDLCFKEIKIRASFIIKIPIHDEERVFHKNVDVYDNIEYVIPEVDHIFFIR